MRKKLKKSKRFFCSIFDTTTRNNEVFKTQSKTSYQISLREEIIDFLEMFTTGRSLFFYLSRIFSRRDNDCSEWSSLEEVELLWAKRIVVRL